MDLLTLFVIQCTQRLILKKIVLFTAQYIFKGTPLLKMSPNKQSITVFLLLTFK